MSEVAQPIARRRALGLEWMTIAWNAVEVFVTIGLGIAARSLALVAFGLDSIIEIWASMVVLWHVSRPEQTTQRTARALRLVAGAFFSLGVFLLVVAIVRVSSGAHADSSPIGIAYLAVTVVVMLTLARLKAATGRTLGDHPLSSEARMTLLDGFLALAILAALVVNAWLGWWWADPIAAGVVGVLALIEGNDNRTEAAEMRASAVS